MRETDGGERGKAVGDVDLDIDRVGFDAEDGGGTDPGEHGESVAVTLSSFGTRLLRSGS